MYKTFVKDTCNWRALKRVMPALQMLDFQVLASRTVVVPDGLGGTSVVPQLLVGNRKSPRVILQEGRVLTVMEINLKQRANQGEQKTSRNDRNTSCRS